MKKLSLILLLSILSIAAKSQAVDTVHTQIDTIAEKPPEFNGGLKGVYRFIGMHFRYPAKHAKTAPKVK